ncbi:MAG: BtaA family protein [Actinomycetota bacterium]|nr:BtaA family protein [Actinomycetota bacterium]
MVEPLRRLALDGARDDRLYFAQVREDPVLEIEALEPAPGRTLVVVASGGCTALSLVAAGAGEVVAVDLNRVQNHLVELKAAAVAHLEPDQALAFLGGAAMPGPDRLTRFDDLLGARLSTSARSWWDGHRGNLGSGVLGAGVTERFIGLVVGAIRLGIHPPERIDRMLSCPTLADQRVFFRREWDTRRWHHMFSLLLNRAVFRKAYHPAFFEHVQNPSFARHFEALAERALTEVPISSNYFVHHMFAGSYPVGVPGGLPPYLDPGTWDVVSSSLDCLTLVDGGYTDYLRTRSDESVHGFAVSNICEWFTPAQVDELFAEVVRTAVPGARLVFRNFVGWTEVPERWQSAVVEDRAWGEDLIRRDRSAVQRRIAVCRIKAETG